MTELIISEKPSSALKIAQALADGKPLKKSNQGVPYYLVTHKSKDIIVASTVGHVFGLGEKDKGKWTYPVFDIEWKKINEINKEASFTTKYASTLKKLSKDAKEFTIATDYDVEGEVIGLNILRYICKQKDANRMKFSTLTKPDLIEAYEHKSKTMDWGQAMAGETRHKLDWFYGINLSRALTSSIKKAGAFKIMSSGRVQGPALKIIVSREKDIRAFKSEPFWQIHLLGHAEEGEIEAWHEKDKFFDKSEADRVMENVRGKDKGIIKEVTRNQFQQSPPVPFDLTSLQTESYRCLSIFPKETQSIAQELYTAGYISYPRTSSQQLPPGIDYKKILTDIAKQQHYKELAQKLLKKGSLKPNNGKKTDPAHPAIYPTGVIGHIEGRTAKVYDLIVRRFFSTFAESAVRETMTIKIDVNSEIFQSRGTRTLHRGWHIFYGDYASFKEEGLPDVKEKEVVEIKKISQLEKKTSPPKRYTPASIIKELEKKGLGTKATRSEIVDTLFRRGYVDNQPIEATELGMRTIETLEKYCPDIIDEELTRHFEIEMDEIREKTKKEDEVLEEAKAVLLKILDEFKKKEHEIGGELRTANREAMDKANTLGGCPNCEGTLMIRRGKFGRFVACNNYPECKTTFKLPASGMVKTTDNKCQSCNHPMISIIRKAKKPQIVCINTECPEKGAHENIEEKACPKCGIGKMVLRKSVYGAFLACNQYPKCRSIEKIKNTKDESHS